MNNVIINRGQGGLGRQPLGQDYISGLLFYPSSTTFSALGISDGTVLKFGGISDAVNAGITNKHIGETQAQISCTVTTVGSTGDIISVYFNEPTGSVLLGTYTQVVSDTVDMIADDLTNAINANTITTGYSAVYTASTATFTLTVRAGLGAYPQGSSVTSVVSNNIASTFVLTPVVLVTGVASQADIYYYHINRFFTQTPNSTLYVGFYTVSSPQWLAGWNFPEVSSIQNYANGSIRQLGIYQDAVAFNANQVTAIQFQVTAQIAKNAPLSVLLGADMHTLGLDTLPNNLSTLNSEHVSVIAGQDVVPRERYYVNYQKNL